MEARAATNLVVWNGKEVPPHVKHALEAPFRGQALNGSKAKKLLSFYEDQPKLSVGPADAASPFESVDASRLTASKHVSTVLVLKADKNVSRETVEGSEYSINTGIYRVFTIPTVYTGIYPSRTAHTGYSGHHSSRRASPCSTAAATGPGRCRGPCA